MRNRLRSFLAAFFPCIAAVLLVGGLMPGLAHAHKLNVFASVKENRIEGNAYFRGNIPAQEIAVIARDPAGKELARTKTDSQGKFSFPVTVRCDYRLTVETEDGHGETFTVRAEELPASTSQDAVGSQDTVGSRQNVVGSSEDTKRADASSSAQQSELGTSKVVLPAPSVPSPLEGKLDAIQQQVVELRQQVADSQQELRFRDLLGGIGYIVGVCGVYFFLAAKRRFSAAKSPPPK